MKLKKQKNEIGRNNGGEAASVGGDQNGDEVLPFRWPAITFPRLMKCSCNVDVKIERRIRERLISTSGRVSPSSYDTAWVAMVPSREYSGVVRPCFPECLDWIMENQNPDGSWGLQQVIKDSLSCTLASLLALRRWNVGQHLVHKGLEFIGSNDWAVSDNDQVSPIGFDIIFPMMINYASELDLALPIKAGLVDLMLRNRDSDIRRRNQNLDYVAEGIGELFDWNKAFNTQQRSNGSLFNSPATTAAALIHCHNDKCFEYLHMVLKEFKTWVPAVYPMDIYTRLRMVDILESLGVDHYFRYELNNILEETYRLWKEKDEEILEDITCRAIAFRLLRIKGYEVSPDELGESVVDQEKFFETVSMQMNGVNTVLELYRASQFRFPKEEEGTTLGKINVWTSTFLKQQLQEKTILDKQLQKQVEYDLKNFHGTLDRVGDRQALELYDIDRCEILKTAYRWYAECRLDSLKLGRDVLRVSHFLTCAILPDIDLSDARMSYAKTITLVTCVDDLFDHYGSRAESLEILELIKGWNDPSEMSSTYGSQAVEIIFKALYSTVNELAAKASIEQGRCVKQILINLVIALDAKPLVLI
ncbi:hypothetical protein RD792_008901 [Penstemon davidsonii]|uniref:Uncharacterized protein n=1 Tax=Penstemon davidsonii TaxID=160366 RepID=A0ABR0DBB7_9LAMI|nr:hypothetical protein RD792_008901 [Penstemon davidsonii]